MKSLLIPTLTLALLIYGGLLFLQAHRDEARFARQEQAISLVQSRYDALLRENQAAKHALAQQQLARTARAKAQTLAPRYAALDKITGYSPKPARK